MSTSTELISAVERLVRRDRAIAAAMLCAIAVLAWIYLLRMDSHIGMEMGAGMDMDDTHMHMDMPGMMMPAAHTWTAHDAFLLFLMWSVMMVAMMLPSASPKPACPVVSWDR